MAEPNYSLIDRLARQERALGTLPPVDGGGGGGDDGRMETRVSALEAANLETRDRLARIETRLDFVATKSDLHEALHSLTWKLIGSCALLVAATFAIAKLVH